MRYFTKEWYNNTIVSEMCFQMRKDRKAATFSEKFFESLYESQKSWYVKHLKRASKHTKTVFDQSAAEAEFVANYKENLAFVKSSLPEEILVKVADVRVLALGIAEYDVLTEITRFCGRVNRQCEQVRQNYEEITEALAEKLGWYPINSLNMLANAPIAFAERSEECFSLKTSPEVTEIACNLTLKAPFHVVSGDEKELVGAMILHFELLPLSAGELPLEFSLLCAKENGDLVEFTVQMNDFEIEDQKA